MAQDAAASRDARQAAGGADAIEETQPTGDLSALLQAVLDSFAVPMVVLSHPDKVVLWASSGTHQVLGDRTGDRVIGRPFQELVVSEDQPLATRALEHGVPEPVEVTTNPREGRSYRVVLIASRRVYAPRSSARRRCPAGNRIER